MASLIDAALAELGVRRMLIAIHDVSFPSDPAEDIGRGSPSTAASARLFGFIRELGFTGIQLGPQGQTSRDNPSPYDGTIFSRHLGSISLRAFDGLVDDAAIAQAVVPAAAGPAQHKRAYDTMHALVEQAHQRMDTRPALRGQLAEFRHQHSTWVDRDALFSALCSSHAGSSFRDWPIEDRDLWKRGDLERYRELVALHATSIERYALGQLLAHQEHARVRAQCGHLGLKLYGDLQVGYAEADAWAHAAAFLPDYAMGAPPSRTNPDGQPWNYPVLDPDQYDGAARALVVARVDKAFTEYDSLRIDHPHGLVCPWVYRADHGDPAQAVREGARLFESPDLVDHVSLARFAITRADQIERGCPRYSDGWVQSLTDEQVARYAVLFDAIAAAAEAHGRSRDDLSCEVLSTMPLPLQRVIQRHGLGRWRVTQKANLADANDVYRTENVDPADWVMLGNHDTAPIFALIKSWPTAKRTQWIAHLARRLSLSADQATALEASDGRLATAMLAELFMCRAENVSIFFADLFGIEERFNAPGTISDENWSLRVPADFDAVYTRGLANEQVLDIRHALALALGARGSTSGLAAQLI